MKRNTCDPKKRASFPTMMLVFCVFFFFLFWCRSFASAGKHQRAKDSSSFSRVVDEENFDTFAKINGGDNIGNDGGLLNSILSDLMWVNGKKKGVTKFTKSRSDFERECASSSSSSESERATSQSKTFAKCAADNAQKIEEYRIDVSLNVAFVGFENDGRYDVSIRAEEQARWLERLNVKLRHEYVGDEDEEGEEDKRSKVSYNVHSRVLQLGSNVLKVFEEAIEKHSRDVHRLHGQVNRVDSRIVDAYAIEKLADDLAEFLGLEEEHFMIVVNAKTVEGDAGGESKVPRYGFRYGLTDEEVVVLREDAEVSKKAELFAKKAIEWRAEELRSGELTYDHDDRVFLGGSSGGGYGKKTRKKKTSKITEQLKTLLSRDGFGAHGVLDEMDEIEDDAEFLRLKKGEDVRNDGEHQGERSMKKMLSMHDLRTFGDLWAARQDFAVEVNGRGGGSAKNKKNKKSSTSIIKVVDDSSLKQFALQKLNGDDIIAATRLARQIAKIEQGHEGCLTEAILSSRTKTVFLDLSAGPFTWGSLERAHTKKVIGHGAHDFPSTKMRFGSGRKMTSQEFAVKRKRLSQQLDAARGRRLEKSHQSRDELTSKNLAAVEIDLLERFFNEHCLHEANEGAAKACEDAMKTKTALEHGADADFDVASFGESVRLSGDGSEDAKTFFQTPGQFANDVFLAEATAMIGAYASSVIVPPATRRSFLKRAKPYKTIHAYMYVLELGEKDEYENNNNNNNNKKITSDKKSEYQYAYSDALRLEILDALDASSLKSTKVSATARIVTASEEPAMASAFASALRTGKVSGFGVDGKQSDHARARWLDVDALAQHLLVDDEKYTGEDEEDKEEDNEDHLEIPIFVFDQRFDGEHRDSPLLFTNAKPVEVIRDAIFVTRSSPINEKLLSSTHGRMPFSASRSFCEIKTLEADFADPAREVASMVAQFVSGLIAPHESTSFTSSHQNGSEENVVVEAMNGYAWSVGDNPLSFTTPGSRFGSIHREIARRNIVVAQIDRVLLTYNRAVVSLERIDAKSDGVYEAAKSGEGKRLSAELRASKKAAFRYLKEAQTLLSSVSSHADEASAKVSRAKKEVDKFFAHATVLSDHVHAREKRKQYLLMSSASSSASSGISSYINSMFRTLLWFLFAILFFYLRMKQTTDKIRTAKTRWTKSALD